MLIVLCSLLLPPPYRIYRVMGNSVLQVDAGRLVVSPKAEVGYLAQALQHATQTVYEEVRSAMTHLSKIEARMQEAEHAMLEGEFAVVHDSLSGCGYHTELAGLFFVTSIWISKQVTLTRVLQYRASCSLTPSDYGRSLILHAVVVRA